MGDLAQRLKQAVTTIGGQLPKPLLVKADVLLSYIRYGRWLSDHDFHFHNRVANREKCFEFVAAEVGHNPVLLMEFGVHKGASLRTWSGLLTHPDTQLIGFDSFEGLPETFSENRNLDRDRFDVGGEIPIFDDPRISLVKGWFDDTLQNYRVPSHDQLILCLDADLYSSTRIVLSYVSPWIVPGTYIYFDELAYVDHEALAFSEFMKDTGKRFTPLVGEWSLNRCVFRCVA